MVKEKSKFTFVYLHTKRPMFYQMSANFRITINNDLFCAHVLFCDNENNAIESNRPNRMQFNCAPYVNEAFDFEWYKQFC